MSSPYQTKRYRAMRARVAAGGMPCHYCGRPATTVEHLTPVALGGGAGDLVAACAPCNYSRGARLGNTLRRRRRGASTRLPRRWRSRGDDS